MPAAPNTTTTAKSPADLKSQVAAILRQLRPAIQSDGGDIELVDVSPDGATVKVRLLGACIGCPSAAMTLRHGVEQTLRQELPQIRQVLCV